MKYMHLSIGLLLTLILFFSCSSPERSAKKELQAKGIEVTADSLVAQAKVGNVNTVQLLLKAGVPIESAGVKGDRALSMAAAYGHIAVIHALLSAGADIDRRDKHGYTALTSAVRMGKVEAATVLLKAGANAAIESDTDKSALDIAIEKKNWPMVTALGKAGVNLDRRDKDGRTKLMEAIDNGEKELAEALIAAGADFTIPDYSGEKPFSKAVNQNLFHLAALMAQQGTDVNSVYFISKEYSPLMSAIEHENVELVKALIDAGANVNFAIRESQISCLYTAVYYKQKDIVVMLIEAGADVNAKNIYRDTPLYRVTVDPAGKDLEIAEIILQSGADINAVVNVDGRTALHVAVLESDDMLDSLAFLLEKGAATDIYDNKGQTPLTLAALHNKPKAAKALIEAGADVNYPAMNGDKPRYTAEKLEHNEIARMLRVAGATKK